MRERRPRLADKVAIVTGAGSSAPGVGTGRAISILFAQEGARVVLVDKVEARAQETLKLIQDEGGEASVFVGDVTVAGDCQGMAEAAVQKYGRLDVLVNNVAILGPGTVVSVSEEDWDRVLTTNLKSMMLAGKYAVPKMVEGGGGSIINISSAGALRGGIAYSSLPYNAAKAGVNVMALSMAVSHGRSNIRVNTISPGDIWTPMVSVLLTEEQRKQRPLSNPLGAEGTAWDVAWAALFFASDEARWITGVNLPVDGGKLAMPASPTASW